MADKSVLGPFWGLASNDRHKQLQSAKDLIVLLQQSQEEYQSANNGRLSENLNYAVERLVRGLSSNREGARQGFAACLTEVLSLFTCVSVDDVLGLTDKHLTVTGSAKAQEARGVHFGQVCALLAVVQSGRVRNMSTTTICTMLQRFDVLANKKLYLRAISTAGMTQLIRQARDWLNFEEHVWPRCKGYINGGWEKCSPDTLHLMLSLQEIYGKDDLLRSLLKDKWSHRHLLHVDNYIHVAAVLKESTLAHPAVHLVWPAVLDAVRKKDDLTLFWKAVVDDSLVQSSHERKYLTFKLVELLIPSMVASEVAAVFTPNVLRCLRNNLSLTSNYLHSAAKHLAKCVQAMLSRSPDKSLHIALLVQLQSLGKGFDATSKYNMIGGIVDQLDIEAVHLYIDHLWNTFLCPTVDSDVDRYRQSLLEQIMTLFRNSKLKQLNPEQWMVHVSKMLFQQAFFHVIKVPKRSSLQGLQLKAATPPISIELQQILQQRFISVLVDLSILQPHIEKGVGGAVARGMPGTDQDGEHLVRQLVDYADGLLSVSDSCATPVADQSAETCDVWRQLMGILGDCSEDTDGTRRLIRLLMCHAGLQLFYDRSSSTDLLKELFTIHSKVTEVKMVVKDEPHWTEVLTDVLLGFLAQPSQLWRTLCKQVYRHITSHITSDALELVIKVLDPRCKEELHGYLQLVCDDEAVAQEESTDEEEVADSVASGEERCSSTSEDDDGESDMEFEVDEEFRKEIKAALGDAALPSSEGEDIAADDDLDDEAMSKIDGALARAFQARKKSLSLKKERKDFNHQLMDFRLRVLDLVEVYIRWQSKSINSLDLILPLFRLMMSCSNESLPLANRAANIFSKKLCHAKEYPRIVGGAQQSRVFGILQQLLQAAYKVPTGGQELIMHGSMFLLKVLRSGREEATSSTEPTCRRKRKHSDGCQTYFGLIDVPAVTSLFENLLADFVTNKNSHVHHMLFAALVERYPDLGWNLSSSLTSHLPQAVNHFRRGQVCEVITSLLCQPVQLPEVKKEFMLSISKDLKCFCIDCMKSSEHEKKSKHTKPVIRLLHQLIVSCRGQAEVFDQCFNRDELLTEIHELTEIEPIKSSQAIVTECRKLVLCLNEMAANSQHRTKKSKH